MKMRSFRRRGYSSACLVSVAATCATRPFSSNSSLRRFPVHAEPFIHSSSSSSSAVMLTSSSTARRFKSFHFYLNLEDPDDTRRYVEEKIEKLLQEKKQDSSAYLHTLLNLSLSYYQAEDYIKAREFALYTHDKTLAHNSKSSFVFLTAKTCAKCSATLADQYEAHVNKMEELAHTSVALAPKPSVVFSAKRAIAKLREDATRFEGIATRIYNRPDMAFMQGFGYTHTSKKHGTNSSSSDYRDRRTMWSEDGNNVDEDYEEHYGTRWQSRRTRPEHVELKKHYQQTAARSGGKWTVPK